MSLEKCDYCHTTWQSCENDGVYINGNQDRWTEGGREDYTTLCEACAAEQIEAMHEHIEAVHASFKAERSWLEMNCSQEQRFFDCLHNIALILEMREGYHIDELLVKVRKWSHERSGSPDGCRR